MMKRVTLTRVAIGRDELVVSLTDHDKLDLRLWTLSGSIGFPSRNGLTINLDDLPALIAALRRVARKDAA